MNSTTLRVTALSTLFCLSAGCSAQMPASRIVLGDVASEKAASLMAQNSSTGTDANGLSFRRLDKSGQITFEVACDPVKQNYLTVRLNGSDANPNYLYLVQPDGAKNILDPVPEGQWGSLDHSSQNAPFVGRYYYSTYIVPLALTQGKTTVRLTIESRGSFNFYGGHIQDEQKEPSKAIYLVALSTNPFYTEAGEDKLGQLPPKGAPVPSPAGLSSTQYLQTATQKAIEQMMSWQLYGDSFKKARAFSPGFSPMLEGAIVTHQDMTNATTDGRFKDRENWTEEQWLASFTIPAVNFQNWCPMMGVEILGNTYIYPWAGKYQHNPETLDRIFKALDFWCLAQDRVGAFAVIEDNGHPRRFQWIGAKTDHSGTRDEGYNWDLQANGVPSLAKGFIFVYNDIISRKNPDEMKRLAAYLDEKVDNDNDGQKQITRREALAQLYSNARAFFANKGGKDYFDPSIRNSTPSQGFNIETLYSLNRALKLLDESLKMSAVDKAIPSQYAAWPTTKATDRLPQMLLDRLGEMADGERWFSGQKDGLSYEGGASGGGFDGNYGVGMQGGLDNLARITEGDTLMHEAVVARLKAVLAGNSHFYRREVTDGQSVMTTDYIMPARNIFNFVKPSYSIQSYAALNLNDPIALRKAEIYRQDGRAFLEKPDSGPFFYYQVMDLQALANSYAAIEAKNAAKPPVPLPMEDGAPDFVWSDIDAQCVVLKNKGEKLYLAFNWRRDRWQLNDLARVHFLSPIVRRVANIAATHQGEVVTIPAASQNPIGLAPNGKYYDHHAFEILNQVRFGKYLIAQNVSKTRTFNFDAPGVKRATDLATKRIYTRFPIAVAPRTTLVLEVAP
ncbi:hypothetical protein IAD21_04501 [Abditibacteriota bacterium]|nr:hypothetical protein IAD21_04501 [Abditibacteriota bacterium]